MDFNDINAKLKYSEHELFGYLWIPEINGEPLRPSKNSNNVDCGRLSLRFLKSDDPKNWPVEMNKVHVREFINVFPMKSNPKILCIATDMVDAFPIDEKAFRRLVMLVAESQNSDIREAQNEPAMTIAAYGEKYNAVLNASYETLMRRSVKEYMNMDLKTEEPIMDEYE